MKTIETEIPGVLIVEPDIFRDERGFFLETWSRDKLDGSVLPHEFVQDNHSRSVSGVVRGLHYQLDTPQGKLVHVARGRIFDVAVDIRLKSPTFGRWTGIELSDENLRSLWIPPGFAHGFCVLSDLADVIYKCTSPYSAADDRGVAWNDPSVGIRWPCSDPVISEKDRRWRRLDDTRADLPLY